MIDTSIPAKNGKVSFTGVGDGGSDRLGGKSRSGTLFVVLEGSAVALVANCCYILSRKGAFWVQIGMHHAFCQKIGSRVYKAEVGGCSAHSAAHRAFEASALAVEVAATVEAPGSGFASRRATLLQQLLLEEMQTAPSYSSPLQLPDDARIRLVAQALIGNPSEKLSTEAWARSVGMSRRSFTRMFRQECNASLGEWRKSLRHLDAVADYIDYFAHPSNKQSISLWD